ncbi:MAG: outer membrane protein assembly factor BamA [Planctomycetota bacterium]
MIRTKRLLAVLIVLVSATCLTAGAQTDGADNVVADVNVQGNERIGTDRILARLRTRPGQPFDEQIARDDQRRLMATGLFDDVAVVRTPADEGVVVTFVVRERRSIRVVAFRGNKFFSDKKLRDALGFDAGDALDYGQAALGRLALEDLYQDKGFHFADVRLDDQALRRERRVVYTIVEGPRVRIRSVGFRFEGEPSFSERKLRKQIKTSKGFWLLSPGRLDPRQLERDATALRVFYRDEGFFDVQVAPEVRFSADKTAADVTFIIDEGPRYEVGAIRIEGNEVYSDAELIDRLDMVPGEDVTALARRRDVETLRDAHGRIGYIDVAVDDRVVYLPPGAAAPPAAPEDAEGPWVAMHYRIEEGKPYRLGRVTIRGNTVTKDRVIRRQLTLLPGQWFDLTAVEESRRRLRDSRLFSEVEIAPYGDEPRVRNALVSVEEGKTAELMFGAGYSTNDGVLFNISFAQRNFSWTQWPTSFNDLVRGRGFKGDGQTLRLQLETGSKLSRASINWREPYFLDRPIALGAGAHHFERQRESYDESRTGGQVSLGRLFPNRWYGEIAVLPENVRLENFDDDTPSEIRADRGDTFLTDLQGILVRDRTDSRWKPSTGGRLMLKAEQFVGDESFTRLAAEYKHYWTLYVDPVDRKHILATRVRGDVIVGDAPVFHRFFGGGVGSLRGFAYRGISPRTDDPGLDDPIGGEFMAYAGAEYTFPLAGEVLRGVLFLDSGTVEESVEADTWRVSTGFGFRLLIPYMGNVPVMLDFGFPLVKDDADDRQTVNFTIGWVF